MPESMDFHAWLDQTEREAHDAIARSYAEGRAALRSRPGTVPEPKRDATGSHTATVSDPEPAEGDRGREQHTAASAAAEQHS